MKLSFKEIDDGLKNEIFVDDVYVGHVEVSVWNQKWKIYPQFSFGPIGQGPLYVEHSSFYKAGKALADLYCKAYMLYDYEHDDHEYKDTDTQPIDMRGLWGVPRRRP
jgi:hypothetical protein